MPELTVCSPTGPAVTYRFDKEALSIGRSAGCDLVLRQQSMSREHAEIRRSGAGWVLLDLGSRNGTELNGRPVLKPEPLQAGDRIGLGDTVVVFDRAPAGAAVEGDDSATFEVPWVARGSGRRDEATSLVGSSPALRKLLATIDRIAPSNLSVLISGENGTGKELVARRIHARSSRASGAFVVVNCPALHGALIEPELFGIERGVATGVEARRGWFEAAQGGTLFLDEIGDMDLVAQAKVLRFLQERTIERVGGRKPIPVDVRIVAATHHDLERDIANGSFRRDLYHRLKAVSLELPPLRERRDDVLQLVAHFLGHGDGPPATLDPEALELLLGYPFPGNVRELEHAVEGARVLAEGGVIRPQDLPLEMQSAGASTEGGRRRLDPDDLYRRIVQDGESFWVAVHEPFLRRQLSRDELERFLGQALTEAGGSYKAMARLLAIEPDYKRLMNFLDYHGLGTKRRPGGGGEPRDDRP